MNKTRCAAGQVKNTRVWWTVAANTAVMLRDDLKWLS